MKKRDVILAAAICFILGCSSSRAAQIHVDVDREGQCMVDGDPCRIGTLNTTLTPKRHRARGECSIRVACASNLTSSVIFQVMEQASISGIFKMTLQLEGKAEAVNCSRPTLEQLPESKAGYDSIQLLVSKGRLTLNGAPCSLSDLPKRMKDKAGPVVVRAHDRAALADTYSVLNTCRSLSLKAWLFKDQ
jgi:biopolymer transport protein ExbD